MKLEIYKYEDPTLYCKWYGVCEEHSTYVDAQTKKELQQLDTTDFCNECYIESVKE